MTLTKRIRDAYYWRRWNYKRGNALEFILAGATALQIGTATLMIRETKKLLQAFQSGVKHGVKRISELIGGAHDG